MEDGDAETARGVGALVAEEGVLPALETRVGLSIETKCAAVKSSKVGRRGALDGDFVVVLQVGANAGKIGHDGDVELFKLGAGTDTAELEDLGRVVSTASDDDFARCLCRTSNARFGVVGARAGAVEVLAVKELDTGCARLVSRLVKGHLGNMAVDADIKRVLLGAVAVLGVADSNDEFAGSYARMVLCGDGDLVVAVGSITSLGVGVGIAQEKLQQIRHAVHNVSRGESTANEETEQLGVLDGDGDGRILSIEPPVVSVALGTGQEIVVALETGKVLAHVLVRPRVVASQLGDTVKVGLVRVDGNESIVGSAAAKRVGTRVQNALHLGASRWVEANVSAAVGSDIFRLVVESLARVGRVVLDEEVPRQSGIFRREGRVRGDRVVVVASLVVSGFDEQCLVAGHGKASSQWTTTSARSDDDVLIAGESDGLDEASRRG